MAKDNFSFNGELKNEKEDIVTATYDNRASIVSAAARATYVSSLSRKKTIELTSRNTERNAMKCKSF